MKFTALLTLIFLSSAVLAGGPKIKSITKSTDAAKPGDNITITVTLKGKAKLVKSMAFIVREYPYDVPPFQLKAVEGKKGKVWSTSMPIPYEAPSGVYNLELKVSLEDGSILEEEEYVGNAHGKAGTVIVTVL